MRTWAVFVGNLSDPVADEVDDVFRRALAENPD
jgi:hypothetical protein